MGSISLIITLSLLKEQAKADNSPEMIEIE